VIVKNVFEKREHKPSEDEEKQIEDQVKINEKLSLAAG
jgi:hypothetical protein